jgi:hypothetical protein
VVIDDEVVVVENNGAVDVPSSHRQRGRWVCNTVEMLREKVEGGRLTDGSKVMRWHCLSEAGKSKNPTGSVVLWGSGIAGKEGGACVHLFDCSVGVEERRGELSPELEAVAMKDGEKVLAHWLERSNEIVAM